MPIGVTIGLCSALLTAIVTELFAHRCLAHHAFRVSPGFGKALDTYFRVVVWTDPESWAAVHRIHHRYSDLPKDPHSPVLRPAWHVLAGSPYLFAIARKRLPAGSYTEPTRAIWWLRFLVPAAYLVAIGPVQTLVATVVHLVCYFGIMGMVNTVGHLYGRKPHPDVSGYDIAWLAIPLLGHGYHNSHHAHPAAARTGALDPIWPLLKVLAAARLVGLDDRRARTQPHQRPVTAGAPCCDAKASLVNS